MLFSHSAFCFNDNDNKQEELFSFVNPVNEEIISIGTDNNKVKKVVGSGNELKYSVAIPSEH